MISVSHNTGRLTEIRMTAPIEPDDITAMQRDISNIKAPRLVVCAEVSEAKVFSEDLSDRLARFFRSDNARLERVAFVVGGGATLLLQVERMFREGGAQSAPGSRHEPTPSRSGVRGDSITSDDWGSSRDDSRGSQTIRIRRPPSRRAFRTAAEAMPWLDEVLNLEERARLRRFLDVPRAAI